MGERRNTDDSDGLHVAVRKGEETLSGESHLGMFFAILAVLVTLFVLEFVPERLGGETGTCRAVKRDEKGQQGMDEDGRTLGRGACQRAVDDGGRWAG